MTYMLLLNCALKLVEEIILEDAMLRERRNSPIVRLDAFSKLRKATVSFIMFVRPSLRSHGTPRLTKNGLS